MYFDFEKIKNTAEKACNLADTSQPSSDPCDIFYRLLISEVSQHQYRDTQTEDICNWYELLEALIHNASAETIRDLAQQPLTSRAIRSIRAHLVNVMSDTLELVIQNGEMSEETEEFFAAELAGIDVSGMPKWTDGDHEQLMGIDTGSNPWQKGEFNLFGEGDDEDEDEEDENIAA